MVVPGATTVGLGVVVVVVVLEVLSGSGRVGGL
jgi:hypothetical protein